MITIALGAFIIGTFTGLAAGRFFCKWHHKNDMPKQRTFTQKEYNPLEQQDDCCGGRPTIGQEIEQRECCGGNCECKDE